MSNGSNDLFDEDQNKNVAQIIVNAISERAFNTGEVEKLNRIFGRREDDRVIAEAIPQDIHRRYNDWLRVHLGLEAFCLFSHRPTYLAENKENPRYFYVRDLIEAVMDELEEMILSELGKEFLGEFSYDQETERPAIRFPGVFVVSRLKKQQTQRAPHLRLVKSSS